ncbi:MAG: tRNA uridine-5-carboxymethylaminomethyl(34) synthesis GTPase MnmE [Legionella sp.]|nr:tRNA uridine-5-carboxymethylaminomethyl(34) synthesis GTPase MnmE [Legionella sp.]
MLKNQETIVAISTPPGRGGIGIVRLSGPLSYSIALSINEQKPLQPKVATYCFFKDQHNELIDTGLALFFKAPHSFTGEDVVEFQLHGSPFVLDQVISETLRSGARLARPGEFSERAFLNDKIDLAQAEAVHDLIHAHSQTAARFAVRSLQGEFSKRIEALNKRLIHLRLFVEASIDFSEEEIDFLNRDHISNALSECVHILEEIRASAFQGSLLREGLTLVIAGRPNAGKSTLMNLLAGKEVAIVTDIAGTTRDLMRESISMDDIPLHLVDTAGLRESQDRVEQEGIRRAWDAVRKADILLVVIDANNQGDEMTLDGVISEALPEDIPQICVMNKIDLAKISAKVHNNQVFMSAQTKEGFDLLKEQIKRCAGYQPVEGQFLARRRHLDALSRTSDYLVNGQTQWQIAKAGELLAEDLRLAHRALGEITGEFSSDDLLGEIFSNFCIGK